jgi:hypothetical protein
MLLAALALACACTGETGTTTAEAGTATGIQTAGVRVLGTLRATIDGSSRTWHVVSGRSGDRPYASGLWMEVEPGRRTIAAGGFDTPSPPLDSFTWDTRGMPTSYGDYTGSTLALNLTVGADPSPFRLVFPPETTPAVLYATRPTLESLDATYGVEDGSVEVTAVSIVNGLANVAGTFTGTFRRLAGDGTIEITGGVFEVSGLPNVGTLR